LAIITAAVIGVLAGAAYVWRDDILRTLLDPRTPYQVYRPPAAPDYTRRDAWAMLPADAARWSTTDPPADVFFVHPTTYDGGRHWNAPLDDAQSRRLLAETMLPNYAGPYQGVGRVFAPRYRQASLYSFLTLRDDARDARRFAYGDVRAAFRAYLKQWNDGRPILLVGVEQGGSLAARLLAEEVARDPSLAARIVGAHLIETVVPLEGFGAPECAEREQARCVLAYATVREGDLDSARRTLDRALTWEQGGQLAPLAGRAALCVNPVLGGRSEAEAPPRAHLGGANATGLEWGTAPGFMPRQVRTRCQGGLLYVSRPVSASLRPGRGWAERRRAPAYNLFYADLETDARARVRALYNLTDWPKPAPPLSPEAIRIKPAPIHRID
jgi:hypothetical protein